MPWAWLIALDSLNAVEQQTPGVPREKRGAVNSSESRGRGGYTNAKRAAAQNHVVECHIYTRLTA